SPASSSHVPTRTSRAPWRATEPMVPPYRTVASDRYRDTLGRFTSGYAFVAVDVGRGMSTAVTPGALGRRCCAARTAVAARRGAAPGDRGGAELVEGCGDALAVAWPGGPGGPHVRRPGQLGGLGCPLRHMHVLSHVFQGPCGEVVTVVETAGAAG